MPGMFNPFEHPRAKRASLPIPQFSEMLRKLEEIRERVLERLETIDFDESNPLLSGGYVYHMVLQHEYQHNETILQTLQLKKGEPYSAPRRPAPQQAGSAGGWTGMVAIPAGAYSIGTNDRAEAYDNERPNHHVKIGAFEIDLSPVTNGEYLEFMNDGGYSNYRNWSDAGQEWLKNSGEIAPKHWERDGDTWQTRSMDRVGPIEYDHPVCHVCFYEAEAFARWAGKRLPTEQEWEIAASWDPETKTGRKFPWGGRATSTEANIDQLGFGTSPVGSYEMNVSPLGCYGMIGDVWEWTSSDFAGYPGFQSFPYREYSEAFFGSEYKVLRGGSWATRPGAVRNTFRNWDYPIRRQIFSGFRCARSV
jgi:iron(II)-dependent oxidoreductase